MPTGFGFIDYVVVAVSCIVSARLLTTRPERLLLWLPLFLTVDFFVPLVTDLTPGRLVPLILGGWLLSTGRISPRGPGAGWEVGFLLVVAAALLYAALLGDAGPRPAIRFLNYCGWWFIFRFVALTTSTEDGMRSLVKGFAVAGLVHGGYGVYQIVASALGLPFRGVVYGADVEAGIAWVAGIPRINGLADEPKRLGYVLFVAALALLVLGRRGDRFFGATLAAFAAAALLGLSVLTFSVSYFMAALATGAFVVAMIPGTMRFAVAAAAFLGVLLVAAPSLIDRVIAGVSDMWLARMLEIQAGLDARFVYRQEFFAQEYLAANPDIYLFGLGMGRYNHVLHDFFGNGAGLTGNGSLLPLNSQLYEMLFDLGAAGVLIVYASAAVLLVALIRERGPLAKVLASMLLMVVVQSLSIQSMQYAAVIAAAGCAHIVRSSTGRRASPVAAIRRPLGVQRPFRS